MTILLVLLVVALVPTADFAMGPKARPYHEDNWYGGGEHAICLFGSMNKYRSLKTMIPSLLVLVYSSAVRAFKLFPEFTQNQGKAIRSSLSRAYRRLFKVTRDDPRFEGSVETLMLKAMLTAWYVVARFYLDFYISVAAEVRMNIVSLHAKNIS